MDETNNVLNPPFIPTNAIEPSCVKNEATFKDLNVHTVNINQDKENIMINDCTIARESTVTDMGIAAIDAAEQAGYASSATAERIGLAADATAQRIGIGAEATAQRMAIAELDAIGKVGDDVCDSSRDIMRGIHSSDNHVSGSVERLGLFNSGVTERNSDKTQAEVERFGLSELEAIRASERYLYAGMSANAREILLKSCADTSSIKDQSASQFKDLLLQNCSNTSEIKMQAEIHAKDAALAARELIHQGDKNTAAIQLEAFRHKEELARQIAECCCEQKALTLETSHATQDLIRKLDEQRVRDELAKTREELIALRVRSTLTPPLVGSVPI